MNVSPERDKEVQVAEVLEQIRAGVRQRQAELAAMGDRARYREKGYVEQRLRELHAKAQVRERPFASHVPLFGRLIALFRETWNSVAAKWYVRPILSQQNIFNQAVVEMTRELLEANDDLTRRLDEASRYLDQIEERVINADRDMTLLARKLAEGEYRMRQWERQAADDRADLAERLARVEKTTAGSDGTDGDG